MQALYQLVHSLAKEEKRLYNLHGRKGRYTKIYEAYLQAEAYDKALDREIYAKHFGTFSKAFYSMQKNDLMDDLLAVLLEYSNSSRSEFVLSRLRAKYEVLVHKGYFDAAIPYQRDAIRVAEKLGDSRELSRVLEDYRDTLPQCESANWDEYEAAMRKLEEIRQMEASETQQRIEKQKLQVLISSARNHPDAQEQFRELALDSLEKIRHMCQSSAQSVALELLLDCELMFGRAFETRGNLHRRLVHLERTLPADATPGLRFKAVNLVLESAMENGDFLLINGLLYKSAKVLPQATEAEKDQFLATYLELAALYHFYENDLPLCLQEMNELLRCGRLNETGILRVLQNKVAAQIAANLPRAATETLQELYLIDASQRENPMNRLMEIIISVEMNHKEEALNLITKYVSFLRKHPDGRKLSYLREFADAIRPVVNRGAIRMQELPEMAMHWRVLFKPWLWMKAKADNNFYYNYIMDDWQRRKQVLNV